MCGESRPETLESLVVLPHLFKMYSVKNILQNAEVTAKFWGLDQSVESVIQSLVFKTFLGLILNYQSKSAVHHAKVSDQLLLLLLWLD